MVLVKCGEGLTLGNRRLVPSGLGSWPDPAEPQTPMTDRCSNLPWSLQGPEPKHWGLQGRVTRDASSLSRIYPRRGTSNGEKIITKLTTGL